MDKIDFSLIKTPCLIFLCSIVFAIISNLGILLVNNHEDQHIVSMSQSNDTIHARLEKKLKATELYQQWNQYFPNLSTFSFQKSDKLHWLENIQRQAKILNLPSITYNIKAQNIDDKFSQDIDGESSIFSTEIEIRAGLVHEAQLIDFIDQLKHSDLGTFSVEKCLLIVNGETKQFYADRANVTAQCLIKWYTLDKKIVDEFALNPAELME